MTSPTHSKAGVPGAEGLKRFPFPPALLHVLKRLQGQGHQAFVVGGSVRDILLGKSPDDFDVTTDRMAQDVSALFGGQRPKELDGWVCHVLETGLKHGTVTVRLRRKGTGDWSAFEVTTFRGEGAYLDGRHPESVVFLDNVEDDLARRDFTINAMAYDPLADSFVDPFGGEGNLKGGVVRCVGRPLDRFLEDGLRLVRAVRFATRLGFSIDQETLEAIRDRGALDNFGRVSRERQRDEFMKILQTREPARGLRLMEETGLMERFLPAFHHRPPEERQAAIRRLERLASSRPDASSVLRLTAVVGDLAEADDPFRRPSNNLLTKLLRDLRLSNAEVSETNRRATRIGFGHTDFPTDGHLRRALAAAGVKSSDESDARDARTLVDDLLSLEEASGGEPGAIDALRRRIRSVLEARPPLSMNQLALDGREIGEILGTGPGPAVGQAMSLLMDAVLEDPSANTAERLKRILESKGNRPAEGGDAPFPSEER